MFTVRTSISSAARSSTTNASRAVISTINQSITNISNTSSQQLLRQSRSLGYLHKGARVRGLARDEESYLQNSKGTKYELNETNVSSLKKLLGEEYSLPDALLLQILTHKSFAHGLKPFNEKLGVYGNHFLKYKTALYTIGEGLEVEKLGSFEGKKINSSGVLAEFLRVKGGQGLVDSVFWKKRDPLIVDPRVNGEEAVLAGLANAIIGGILVHHGKSKAASFVEEVLLRDGDKDSLVELAKRV